MSVNNCSDHTLESYKFIFESSLDAILLTRTDGTIFYANPASEELFGYTQKEICDLGRIGIVDTKDPNLKIMLDERARLGKSKGELTLIKKDNSRFPAEVSTNIFKDKNCKINTFMTIRDISQRKKAEESLKESEERYHSLFDNNHATMLLINPNNGNIIDANPAATHFYGYNYDELVKMNINEINVLSEEEIHAKMQKSVSSQQNHFLFKHQLANSEIRDVDVYSGKIGIGGEKLLYSIVHDVTDRVIAQNKLKESNEELERFAYVSSHDLQEPLRMVTSFTQLLERRYKGRLDADADEYIEFIVDGAKHMKLLIDDLLMLSRLNTLPRENEFVNLETVLNTVLLNLQISIEENNVQITHDPLPTVYGDVSRKVQVFQNLISNAIKFNDKKITKIHISAKKEENEWIFSVSDNGIGMEPKHLEKIFTIFQRLHTKEEYEGTGIGLAITQKIINQQGGRIWAESELGKGTTFHFTISMKG